MDERSLKDGAGPEAIAVGVACGRMIMVTATEKQGTAFVLDVTDPANTTLLFTRHLSPASETKNPSVAYNDGTLGEVDPESITFLDAHDSPTGYAGVLFAGAWSGTLSFYEFTKADGTKCGSLPPSGPPPVLPPSSPPPVEASAAASLGSVALGTTLLAVTTTALLRGLVL